MKTASDLLFEARNAYHALVTGQAPRVVVDQNGEKVEFTPANKSALSQYITSLEARVAGSITNRPMKVFF
jgi:hypothetical protein